MSTEGNVAVIQRYYDVLNNNDAAGIDEVIAPDAVFREPGRLLEGRAALRQRLADFHTAFPDLHCAIDDLVAGGDKVAVRWTLTGTHRGAFGAFPPTGKPVTLSGIGILRVENGMMAEAWGCFDTLGAMQQFGATLMLPGQGGA